MGRSHDEVVKLYAERAINKRTKDVSWTGNRIFSDDRIIYSYGHHWPMASYLGEKGGKHLFLKNGDRYSSSTAQHTGMVQSACKGPTVSRRAVQAAGIPFTQITFDNILFWQEDSRKWIYKDTETGRYYEEYHKGWGEAQVDRTSEWHTGSFEDKLAENEWTPPKQGQFVPTYRRDGDAKERFVSGTWHVLGVVVLNWKNEFYLCSLDEGSYFVSQLPRQPKSVKDAFESLKPDEVKRAIRKGVEVKRQGEWFFIPTGMDDAALAKKIGKTQKQLKEVSAEMPLPARPESNLHLAGRLLNHDDIFVRGMIRHVWRLGNKYHGTGEHKMLRLGDEWHVAYRNLEKASWSQGGRFD